MPEGTAPIWARWPALFERASGMVYVNADHRRWAAFVESTQTGMVRPGDRALYGRLSHELFHYAQFFACGFVCAICCNHYVAARQAIPFPLDNAKIAAFLSQPQARPAILSQVAELLDERGEGGLTALQIVEGCARLFQERSERPGLLHGTWLLALASNPHGTLYGNFYRAVAAALGARALNETLFLGAVALEFRRPQQAAPLLIALRAAGAGDAGTANLHVARAALVSAAVAHGLEHLGSAIDLAKAGAEHPLLQEEWLYHDSDDWDRDAREAVWGLRGSLQRDFFEHGAFLLNDALWVAKRGDAARRDAAEVRYHFARLALHSWGGDPEEDHV